MRIWKEQFDPNKHACAVFLTNRGANSQDRLIPRWVFFVNVCSFSFEFSSVEQIRDYLDYYSEKIHESSIIPRDELYNYGFDLHECQRWFERLPQYLFEEPKRQKVVKALTKAIDEFDKHD